VLVIRDTDGVRKDVLGNNNLQHLECTRIVELKLLLPTVYYESVAKMSVVIQVHRLHSQLCSLSQINRGPAGFGVGWYCVILFWHY